MAGPADMQRSLKRTPRACERCRQTRRRCEPPYPCRQCVQAGVACDVREKARPHRQQQQPRPEVRRRAATMKKRQATNETLERRSVRADTYEILHSLVEDVLRDRHSYALNCALIEPASCRPGGLNTLVSPLAPVGGDSPPPLTLTLAWNLLKCFRKFMGFQDAKLVDIEELYATIQLHQEDLHHLSPANASVTATTQRLPCDAIGLVFASLALGAVASGDFGHGRFYFGVSTELVKHFVGQPTLELCLTYFLQHVFALRLGTSNYAQGIMAQAVQIANGLGLHDNSHGIPGLQLYLLIYMADQYCSLTHNTEPIIHTSKLDADVFAPLGAAEPQLRTLVDLITINGYLIEQSYRHGPPQESQIAELEAKIGASCFRQMTPGRPISGSFRTVYEPLARIHMMCCRMRLRAPGLRQQASWLPSLCVCLHGAQSVLATYFDLYQPVLRTLSRQCREQDCGAESLTSPVASKIAVTWRQVRRIMLSAFVIIYAYLHGEIVHAEASRFMAMTRLLLEYPRWRWGDKLQEAVQTIVDVSHLAEFDIEQQMQKLLPIASEAFVALLGHREQPGTMGDCSGPHVDSLLASGPWPAVLDSSLVDDFSGANIGTIEDQTMFGLWGNIEFSGIAGSWPDGTYENLQYGAV